MRSITAKLGTMRKTVEWTVYPASKTSGKDAELTVIQSDHRICAFNPVTGEGWLSKACANGAYFIHLNPALGATVVTVPPEVREAALAATPKSGDEIGPGVYVA